MFEIKFHLILLGFEGRANQNMHSGLTSEVNITMSTSNTSPMQNDGSHVLTAGSEMKIDRTDNGQHTAPAGPNRSTRHHSAAELSSQGNGLNTGDNNARSNISPAVNSFVRSFTSLTSSEDAGNSMLEFISKSLNTSGIFITWWLQDFFYCLPKQYIPVHTRCAKKTTINQHKHGAT